VKLYQSVLRVIYWEKTPQPEWRSFTLSRKTSGITQVMEYAFGSGPTAWRAAPTDGRHLHEEHLGVEINWL